MKIGVCPHHEHGSKFGPETPLSRSAGLLNQQRLFSVQACAIEDAWNLVVREGGTILASRWVSASIKLRNWQVVFKVNPLEFQKKSSIACGV